MPARGQDCLPAPVPAQQSVASMTETLITPHNSAQAEEAVQWALATRTPLAISGSDSKCGLGHPTGCTHRLSLAQLSGIISYAPNELVITLRPGTPMAELADALSEAGQYLAFEPPDWGPVYGQPAGGGTIGGVMSCNSAGPRRFKAGAARDHFLGVHALSGRGETFKAGGKVVKNVTGYDLCKLLAGAHGTLAVMTELTLKTLPRPAATETLILYDLEDAAGLAALRRAAQSPLELSGLAHLPAATSKSGRAETRFRAEGPPSSVRERINSLATLIGSLGETTREDGTEAEAGWRAVGDAQPLRDADTHLWRVALPPTDAARVAAQSGAKRWYYDWGGGLIWLAGGDAHTIRGALGPCGGHATLFRASAAMRRQVPVFQPQSAALAALEERVRKGFDPECILNPGRMQPRPAAAATR